MDTYFYGAQADQFTFYRLPKILFTDPAYRGLSPEAKLLYGLFLDRMSLSLKHGWQDDQGRVFIYYTQTAISEALACGQQKAMRLVRELEQLGLIERKRLGQGKPTRIYLRPLQGSAQRAASQQSEVQSGEMQRSRPSKIDSLDLPKSHANKTESSDTDWNEIDPSNPSQRELPDAMDGMDRSAGVRAFFQERWELAYVMEQRPRDRALAEEILSLAVDTVCSTRDSMTIGGETRSLDQVRAVYLGLDRWHLEYVLDALSRSRRPVRNMRAYLLTALYNAPSTIESYYDAWVRADGAA